VWRPALSISQFEALCDPTEAVDAVRTYRRKISARLGTNASDHGSRHTRLYGLFEGVLTKGNTYPTRAKIDRACGDVWVNEAFPSRDSFNSRRTARREERRAVRGERRGGRRWRWKGHAGVWFGFETHSIDAEELREPSSRCLATHCAGVELAATKNKLAGAATTPFAASHFVVGAVVFPVFQLDVRTGGGLLFSPRGGLSARCTRQRVFHPKSRSGSPRPSTPPRARLIVTLRAPGRVLVHRDDQETWPFF
jgi:hypothetical protein